jgi:glycosyltransferase involved in cell wall biosynthesis
MTAVYSLAGRCNHWSNTQLLKECGLIPFMLHKNFGYKAVMVGENTGDYPYLSHLPGLEMDFIPSSNNDENSFTNNQINYVNENYQKMDILILRGLYLANMRILKAYKKKRPEGKVYLYLDANPYWMDSIPWTTPLVFDSLCKCNLISTSCYKMANFLNKKWSNFIVEHIPNGFFDASIKPDEFSQKENIILTVGRIGTRQKANELLMQAFAMTAGKLPGWKLHLAGPIQEDFKESINMYFRKYPNVKEKVLFLGNITDKEKLYAEYAKAKIFALTSISEGGAPNVIAEALFHGCYTITSDIDAAIDITDNGNCGRSFPVGDYDALAQILLEVCNDKEILQSAAKKSVQFAQSHYDWDLIANRINHLLLT